jgi:ABC-type bacteriocin/lantibiotic exporter with double-glycine peptidase domain
MNGAIQFDDVNFIYPARENVSVLRNLSLVAEAGKTTALVGYSGCGMFFYKVKRLNVFIILENI